LNAAVSSLSHLSLVIRLKSNLIDEFNIDFEWGDMQLIIATNTGRT